MNKNFRTVVIYLVLLGVLVSLVVSAMTGDATQPVKLETSEFAAAAGDGLVAKATYVMRDGSINGEYWADEKAKSGKPKPFTSVWAGEDSFNELMATSKRANPELTYNVDNSGPSPWLAIITSLLPILLLVFIMFFFLNQMQGGNSKIMSFGKAKVKRILDSQVALDRLSRKGKGTPGSPWTYSLPAAPAN